MGGVRCFGQMLEQLQGGWRAAEFITGASSS